MTALVAIWLIPGSAAGSDTNYITLSDRRIEVVSPISVAKRERIEKKYEKYLNAKPSTYRDDAMRAMKRIQIFDENLEELPEVERVLIEKFISKIDWFSITNIDGVGSRITAIRIATPDHDYASKLLDRRLHDFAQQITDLEYLDTLLFNGAVKKGVDFSKLGSLNRLSYLQPPSDTDDRDLMEMSNLDSLTFLDLSRREMVDGRFITAFGRSSKLRSIDIRGAYLTPGGIRKLLSLNKLETVLVAKSLKQDQRATKNELEAILLNGSYEKVIKKAIHDDSVIGPGKSRDSDKDSDKQAH